MTIECPRCGTLYRRPRAAPGAGSTYRCARCRHVFDVPADEPAAVAGRQGVDIVPDPDADVGLDDIADDEPRFTFTDDDEPTADAEAEPEPRGSKRGGAGMSGTARFAVRSLVFVTLGYAVVSVYLYTHVDVARDFLRAVPIIGDRLVETRIHPTAVRLSQLRGTYERVQGDRLVFVISGTAVNASPVPVRGVQIEGRIVGGQEQRQVVYCGAAPRDVQDLSLREIALLQTLEPPKEWSLAPGEQAGFLVVFPGPPTDLREFGAEVVAVQAPPRRGQPS